jgi:hypothetical protein
MATWNDDGGWDEYELCRACAGRRGELVPATGPWAEAGEMWWESCMVCRGVGVSRQTGPRI